MAAGHPMLQRLLAMYVPHFTYLIGACKTSVSIQGKYSLQKRWGFIASYSVYHNRHKPEYGEITYVRKPKRLFQTSYSMRRERLEGRKR